MNKKIIFAFCLLLSILLTACAGKENEKPILPEEPEDNWESEANIEPAPAEETVEEQEKIEVDWYDDTSIVGYYGSGELEYDSDKITANVKDIFDCGDTAIIVYDFWGWITAAEVIDRETGERTEIFASSYPYIKGALEDGVLYIMWGGQNFVDGSVSQPCITEIDTLDNDYPVVESALYYIPVTEASALGKGLSGIAEPHNLENNIISQVSAVQGEEYSFLITFEKVDISGYPQIPATEVTAEEGVMTVTMYDSTLKDGAEITGDEVLSAQQTDYGAVVRLELPEGAARYVVRTAPLDESFESYAVMIQLLEDGQEPADYPQGW